MRRNSYYSGRHHLERKRGDRPYDDDQDLGFTTVLTSSEIQFPLSNTTLALRRGLRRVGVDRPMVLNYAGIYEMALMDLAKRFERSSLDEESRQAALAETFLLARALEVLFTGQFRIRRMSDQKGYREYSGYFEHNGEKRLGVLSKIDDSLLNGGRWVRKTTQISVKEIERKTNQGRAVAGSDGEWRIGLRHAGELNRWRVTVAAGHKRFIDSPWLSIFPLSQAISDLRRNGELPLKEGQDPNTFYFTTGPMTNPDDPEYSQSRFNELNGSMRLIFDGLDTRRQA